MSRTSAHKGKTAHADPGSIKIVYDAELMDLGICDKFAICMLRPCCCPMYDMERSYLYIRENSIESNIAMTMCCGMCGEILPGDDCVQVSYFDRAPYAKETCFLVGGCVPCYGPTNPKPEVLKLGFDCCCTYVDPFCCGEKVVIMPFDSYCFCCSNRVGKCDQCCGLFGPPLNNPKIFTQFMPQPKNPTEFCTMAQQVIFDRGGGAPDTAEVSLK